MYHGLTSYWGYARHRGTLCLLFALSTTMLQEVQNREQLTSLLSRLFPSLEGWLGNTQGICCRRSGKRMWCCRNRATLGLYNVLPVLKALTSRSLPTCRMRRRGEYIRYQVPVGSKELDCPKEGLVFHFCPGRSNQCLLAFAGLAISSPILDLRWLGEI